MTVLIVSLCVLLDPRLLQERKYFDLANQAREAAHRLEDPVALREYTCLLTEYYTTQVGFRTFFVKNLHKLETLESLRHHTETITTTTHGYVLEENLEALLIDALQRFPDDFNVRFAVSNYLYRGRCCQAVPKITQRPEVILDTFKQGEAQGIVTAGSMLALALEALAQERFEDANRYIQKGLEIRSDEPYLVQAYMTELLRQRNYDAGIQQARKLFELTFDPEARAEALIGAARGLYAQKKFLEAAETALNAQKLAPQHPLALIVALDSLRNNGGGKHYQKAVINFLAQEPKNPALFETYASYLKLRGIIADDETLMQEYGKKPASEKLAQVTQLVNMGSFSHLNRDPKACLTYYQKARKLAGKLKNPPPDLIPIIDALLEQAMAVR